MLSSVFVLLATLALALARPYLEFCNLVDYTQNGRGGVSISALCGDANALHCQTLNIDPCFTNSGGYLVPAQNSSGHFGSLCTECTIGTSKSSAKDYGRLSCLCQDTSMNSTTWTSIQTGSVINYEADSRMACGPRNSTAAHSVACTRTMTSRHLNGTASAIATRGFGDNIGEFGDSTGEFDDDMRLFENNMRLFEDNMRRFNDNMRRFDNRRRFNDTTRTWNMHQLNETERNMAMGHFNHIQWLASTRRFNGSALHDRRIRTSQDEHNHWLLG